VRGHDQLVGAWPILYQTHTVTGAAATLDLSSVPREAYMADLRVEHGPLRYRLDGGTPVAGSSGVLLYDADVRIFNLSELRTFVAVRDGVTNAVLHIHYYRF
jgi:hypothetical protein